MKKSVSMLLVGAMLTVLVSCSGGTVQSSSSAQAEISPPAQDSSEPLEMFASGAAIEETVLVDASDVKITATELIYSRSTPELKLNIENNTDKDLTFYAGTMGYSRNSINGYMISSGYLNVDVAAGKKANESIRFSAEELALLGITEIADIEIGFNIQDSNNDIYLQTDPQQLKTSVASSYDYDTDVYQASINSDALANTYGYSMQHFAIEELFDQNGIRVISQALIQNSSGELALLLEFVNEGPDSVKAVISDVSVNGLAVCSSIWTSEFITGGKRCVMNLELSSMLDSTFWDIFGIKEVGEVTLSLGLEDTDNNDIAAPTVLSITIPGANTSIDNSGNEVYNDNGIRIVSKGLATDSFELSDDIHALFLVENSGSVPFDISAAYDSLSINGYMSDYICYSRTVASGMSAAVDVELLGSSLKDSGITDIADITELEMTFEIRNSDYKKIAEPTISVDY